MTDSNLREERKVLNVLYVVGIGPGEFDQMTLRAQEVLERCDVIVGYSVYVDLVREHFPSKRIISTPMRREEERCRMAFEEADKGDSVAVICSGDAGVYGMAGLMYAMGVSYPNVKIEVICGVTAALSGAALLGAPLMHDFSVISLSDLMTPWEIIEKRLRLAAESDMVICLYNPSSRNRSDYLSRACEILLDIISGDTVCGVVRSAGRDGEYNTSMKLSELKDYEADMFTTIFVGNSQTRMIGDNMVTPRGYSLEKAGAQRKNE